MYSLTRVVYAASGGEYTLKGFNGRIADILRQTRSPTFEALTETLMK